MSRRFTVYSTTRTEKAIFSLLFQSFYLFQEDTMNTILKTAIFVTALLMLGGCATKALTPEEQAFQDAQRSCTEQTNSMIGGSRYSWSDQLPWSNYFEWCMEGKGYTKDQLKSIWYFHIVISRYDSRGG